MIASLEYLTARRQFFTARACLRWDSEREARMPIRCYYVAPRWLIAAAAVAAIVLIDWELDYYSFLKPVPAAYLHMSLGLARNVLLIVASAEVILFYKSALAAVRTALA